MNEISIAIKISNYPALAELSAKLDLSPTSCHNKDETYFVKAKDGPLQKQYAGDYWEYRQEFVTDEWAQVLVNKFIADIIDSRKDRLKTIAAVASVEFFIGINYYQEANPSFHFDNNELLTLAYIGAELDIDMYCLNKPYRPRKII